MNQFADELTTALLATLIERIARHDASALRTLYELVSPRMFRIAIRILGRRDWAEDVLQESFVNIWRFAGQYRQEVSPPMAWMTTIVRNRTFDFYRQQATSGARAEIALSDADSEIASDMDGPFERLLSSEEARQLASSISNLDVSQRRAVTLAYLCELSHAQVAEAMNAPIGTVKSWIRRGTENLKFVLVDGAASGALRKTK
jgi:RNA polymerase sigma-70 factor, ECF subfamily